MLLTNTRKTQSSISQTAALLFLAPLFLAAQVQAESIDRTEQSSEVKTSSSIQVQPKSAQLGEEPLELAPINTKVEHSDTDNDTGTNTDQAEAAPAIQNLMYSFKNNTVASNKTQAAPQLTPQQAYRFAEDDVFIYEAQITLLKDKNANGYYQKFRVMFDADIYASPNEYALIYADMYIRESGGSWEHYFTTDTFKVIGENSNDYYEVTTTLDQGFRSNHYDILIDIYEYGSDQLLTTYSSNDSNALYALPLESSYLDTLSPTQQPNNYTVYSYGEYGGSNSIPLLASLLALLAIRRTGNKHI